jgi:hypothetical protein
MSQFDAARDAIYRAATLDKAFSTIVRLTRERDEARALVRRFAVDEIGSYITDGIQDGGPITCDLCGAESWWRNTDTVRHGPNCPITQAREAGILEDAT